MATIDKADTIFAHSRPNPADIDMTKVCFHNYGKQSIDVSSTSTSIKQMIFKKVYDAMTFDNPDGGVWKQGWDVSIINLFLSFLTIVIPLVICS